VLVMDNARYRKCKTSATSETVRRLSKACRMHAVVRKTVQNVG